MDVTNINLLIYVVDRIFIENFTNPFPSIQYAAVYRLTLRETLVTICVTSFLIL
jgi:hypothetical protein